ncbi:imm11 family protein [Paenibacillus periandrae]|uniref:imm11 family protein n=1 Tax=Paenibacillus periandrae TaxID=1761741 RepID=UPI001F09EBF3|nr:DUF1629 domain-containing protein [Paenibacillus periandrae]
MQVWKLDCDSNNYEGFNIVDGDWNELIEKFGGNSLLNNWQAIKIKPYELAPRSDAPTFIAAAPLFSAKAVDVLRPIISNFVEILPTEFIREDYFIINVLNVLNCVDYDSSSIVKYRSGRIMRFEKYEFFPEIVDQQHIFKITDISRQAVFVSSEFKEEVIKSGLTGFRFEEVWSSQ